MRDPLAAKRARRLRREMTKSETVLWTVLKGRALGGWKFRRQHPVGPYIADFACLEAKLIVEVDGATHGEAREVRHDARRTAFLEQEGFSIVRVTNTGIYEDLDGAARLIADALAPSGPSGHLPRKRGRTSDRSAALFSPASGGGVSEADGGGEPFNRYIAGDPS